MFKAQHVQFSYFAGNAHTVSAARIFEQAFGMEPDVAQSNKTPNPENPFYSVAESRIELSDGQINARVQIQPARLDVVFTPVSSMDGDPVPLLNPLEIYETVSADFLGGYAEAMKVFRVSTFVQLAQAFGAQADANAFLLAQAGLDDQFPDITDFSLQLNRKKPFDIDPQKQMNRIVRLTETAVQQVDLLLSGGDTPQPGNIVIQYVGGILLDLNSMPDGSLYSAEATASLMNELVRETVRLINSESPSKALNS